MKTGRLVFEGTWEDIQKHAAQLAHRRVQVTVLLPKRRRALRREGARSGVTPKDQATAGFLREFFGAWAGNDLGKCLRSVYATRSKVRF